MDLEHVLTDKTTPEDVLRAQLGAGERLLWMGRPRAGLRLGDYGRIALLLVWLALAAFLLWLLLSKPAGSERLHPVVALLIIQALYFPIVRPVVEVLQRPRTVYAVTDRRILVVKGLRRRRVKSYLLRNLPTPTLSEEYPDGSGTVRFSSWLLFDLIEQAREVSETIHRAQMAVRFPLSYPPRPAPETA